MYKQNQKGWVKHFDFFIWDVVLLEMAFFLSYGIRHDWVYSFNMQYYRRVGVLLALISVCVAMIRESYHGILKREGIEELKNVVTHISIVEISIIAITFFMKDLYYSREVFILFWIIGVFFCFSGRSFWKMAVRKKMLLSKEKRQVIIVTTLKLAEDIIDKLTREEYFDYEIAGIVLTNNEKKQTQIGEYPVLGDLDSMQYVHENVVDEVFVHLEPGQFLERKYIDFFVQTGITVHVDLDGLAELSSPAYIEHFANRAVITTSMKIASPWQLFTKRLMDIVGGH